MSAPKTTTGGRLWEEAEFCLDPKSGLLMTYSPVPGLYILYDYTSALHLYDKIIAGKFTITEAGRTVIEARNESLTDPAKLDVSLFEPSGLNSVDWQNRRGMESDAQPGASPQSHEVFFTLRFMSPGG